MNKATIKKVTAISLFSIVLLILLSLGTWQIKRAQHKASVLSLFNAEHKAYQTLEAIPSELGKLKYTKAALKGEWVKDRDFLLANRIYQQQPGFEVFSLFKLESEQLLLVNRGWIPKQQKENYKTILNNIAPSGTLYTPKKGYTIGYSVEQSDTWPKTSIYLDIAAFSKTIQHDISPLVLVLNKDNKNSFIRMWKPIVVGPERHYGYAVQWFGLAFALVFFGYIWTKKRTK